MYEVDSIDEMCYNESMKQTKKGNKMKKDDKTSLIPQELQDMGVTKVVDDRLFAFYRFQLLAPKHMALLGSDSAKGDNATMTMVWNLHTDTKQMEQYLNSNPAIGERLID